VINLNVTRKWVSALLTDPSAAAVSYQESLASWRQTFVQLTLPVTLTAYVAAALISLVTGRSFMIGSPVLIVVGAAWALGWSFVIALIFDYLAGVFEGKRSFDAAYAVVALAIIPSSLGLAISPVPWIGWLLSLIASIYSLVLAYRFLPRYLEIPETARVKHFALSIVTAIVVNLVVTMTIGAQLTPSLVEHVQTREVPQDVSSGLFGGIGRQAQLTDLAARDVYEPPRDGRLTRGQVERYVDVLAKTAALKERLDGELSEKYRRKEPSISDIFGGIGGVVRLGTAEMEVVKSAGGNWAEHQWVKGQLETARIHQDLSPATAHNYALYREFEGRLSGAD
jgi:hypothetical protein